jgi:hypothetical protein
LLQWFVSVGLLEEEEAEQPGEGVTEDEDGSPAAAKRAPATEFDEV